MLWDEKRASCVQLQRRRSGEIRRSFHKSRSRQSRNLRSCNSREFAYSHNFPIPHGISRLTPHALVALASRNSLLARTSRDNALKCPFHRRSLPGQVSVHRACTPFAALAHVSLSLSERVQPGGNRKSIPALARTFRRTHTASRD
jgi:hypothetical protein